MPGFDYDTVENRINECWNSMIKDARKKPIISMLEEIRKKVMVRLVDQRTAIDKYNLQICPTIIMRVEESKRLQM